MRKISFLLASLVAFSLIAGTALAYDSWPTPSTNDTNRTNGWAHVNATPAIGSVDLEFVSTQDFASCFEYRADGDLSQSTGPHFLPSVDDGLYPYTCVENSTDMETLSANVYVEVRLLFGAEGDERFDWTRFDALPDASSQADCVANGYEAFGFENQGQCVRFVNAGKDSR